MSKRMGKTRSMVPMIEGTRENFASIEEDVFEEVTALIDAGFCSEKSFAYLQAHQIEGYIADSTFPKRDPRFKLRAAASANSNWHGAAAVALR